MVMLADPLVILIEHDVMWRAFIGKAIAGAIVPSPRVEFFDTPEAADKFLAKNSCQLVISDFLFEDESQLSESSLAELLRRRSIPLVIITNHMRLSLNSVESWLSIKPEGLVYKVSREDELPALSERIASYVRRAVQPPSEHCFSWFLVSDIHFGAGPASHRLDRRKVCAALIADVKKAPPANAIFVSGDIAFRGAPAEYDEAATFFEALSAASGVAKSQFFFVPGNHDVDRGCADGPDLQAFHETARRNPSMLDEYLTRPQVRQSLARKSEAYAAFLAKHFPKHPRTVSDSIDWSHVIAPAPPCPPLRLAGLSTVWVSDSFDGCHEGNRQAFSPNLLLARQQWDAALGADTPDPQEIVFLMTHHPPEWLAAPCREELERRLANRRALHLCGHVHTAEASQRHYWGQSSGPPRMVAAATHGEEDRDRRGIHGYAWGALRLEGKDLQIGWAPRIYVGSRDEMRADRTPYELDTKGFAWRSSSWVV